MRSVAGLRGLDLIYGCSITLVLFLELINSLEDLTLILGFSGSAIVGGLA